MRSALLRAVAILLCAAGVAKGADDPRAAPAFRLGDAAAPVRYAARLALDPAQPGFTGEIRIDLAFARATPVLWLHAVKLSIESARFTQGTRTFEAKALASGDAFVGFEAPGEPFAPGPAAVTLTYRGKLDSLATRGLFRQRQDGEWYALSQFEAPYARRAFPSFDEPGWKTPWQLTIDAPTGLVVVSNTPEREAVPVPERAGWTRHAFEETPPLPSYLVALAVGPFDVVDGGVAGSKATRLRYIVPKGRAAEAAYAKQVTPKVLEYLEGYFDMPFPFAKLDSVSIPQTVNFGAMENAGMITYAQTLLVAPAHEASNAFRRRYASVAAHEIAHQWFGDLVTPAWWDDIWLNESFATWLGRKTAYAIEPAWDDGSQRSESRGRAMEIDRLASARAVRNPVRDEGDIHASFDRISYDKGGAVLEMFEAWITPERFRDGVRAYVRRHAGGNATSADFFRAVGEAAGRPEQATRAFAGFIEAPGVPLVSVALRCEKGKASVVASQERFTPVGSNAQPRTWTTPACFLPARGGKPQCMEIGEAPGEMALPGSCPDWAVANAGGLGYYVARYDAALEKRIVAQAARLPAPEAAALATDGRLLAESGTLSIDAALDRANALLAHPAPQVQREAARLLRGLRPSWLTQAQRSRRDAIAQQRLVPAARRLGWVERPGETDALRQARAEILPIAAELERANGLRAQGRLLAMRWADDHAAVPAGLVPAALETAARFADARTYIRLEAALMRETDLRARAQLLKALPAVRDPALRDRMLGLSLARAEGQERLGGRDALALLDEALRDDANRTAAFAYVRANFDALVAKVPAETPSNFLRPLGLLCSRAERDDFAGFFGPRAPGIVGGAPRYRQALERVDLCVAARAAAGL